VFPNEEGLLNDFQKLCYHQEEPFGSASIYAQYKVFELARLNNTYVLIDGQGADELLGGYLPYYQAYLNQLFFWNRSLYKTELKKYNEIHGDYSKIISYKKSESLRMTLGRYKQQVLKEEKPYPKNYLKQQLKKDLVGKSLQSLLRYADRNSMANSVETRLPFLSHSLVEWIFSLPDEVLLKNGWFKFMLRNSADKVLPKEVVWRKRKVGYEPPQNEWLKSAAFNEMIVKSKKLFGNRNGTEESYTNSQNWKFLMAYNFVNQK
jgi:asparagine synthase (glutamine-hydrolysing)